MGARRSIAAPPAIADGRRIQRPARKVALVTEQEADFAVAGYDPGGVQTQEQSGCHQVSAPGRVDRLRKGSDWRPESQGQQWQAANDVRRQTTSDGLQRHDIHRTTRTEMQCSQ